MYYIRYMQAALEQAKKAAAAGEVPVGAVVVKNGEIIAAAHNNREKDNDPLGHAEVEAVSAAARVIGDWRLDGCDIYVTLEPCPMCAGLIINARISRVFFGAYDSSFGSFGSRVDLSAVRYPANTEVHGGIMENECAKVLSDFFKNRRKSL